MLQSYILLVYRVFATMVLGWCFIEPYFESILYLNSTQMSNPPLCRKSLMQDTEDIILSGTLQPTGFRLKRRARR